MIDVQNIVESSIWDAFIEKYGEWSFFQSYTWGEVELLRGEALERFGVYKDAVLVGVLQLAVVYAKRGTFIHIRQGPVVAQEYLTDSQVWDRIIEFLKQKAKDKKAWFVRISPMIVPNEENTSLLKRYGFHSAPIHRMNAEVCWVLDITRDSETLLREMRKTTRYCIRQAEKLGVVVKESTDISIFLDLYKLTAKRHGFVPHIGIAEEFALFSKNGNAKLYGAYHNGVLLSTAIIIYFQDQAIYHHGASLVSKIPAAYLLQWKAILDAQRAGKRIYNFWGIAPENKKNHPWRGHTLFKQGFGGEIKEFMHAQDLATSPLYGISYTIELQRKWRKGY